MTTFDSTKATLGDLLKQIGEGKIQLPDFQRGWVWDDDHIRDLLVSVARSFPIGAVMLLETGGEVRFQTRPVEGLEETGAARQEPERLILDGQQRLTTLTQALLLDQPVRTRTAKGKKIQRSYYFDVRQALAEPLALEEAIVAVDERKQIRSNFGRDVDLDLSTVERECELLHFPCNRILRAVEWQTALLHAAPDNVHDFLRFQEQVIMPFLGYQLPVIELKKQTSKEAVCLVFEKVNTGGVQLSVFELITASFAADGYNLRDDWHGSRIREVEARAARIAEQPLVAGTEASDFLQALSILATHERKKADLAEGKTGKQVRPISAKRADVLQLPLDAWKQWADPLEQGFREVAGFLKGEGLTHRRELPYATQLVPLAAVMTRIGRRWHEPRIHEKLARWYWCGVLGELYGGAVETRFANDYEELLAWIDGDDRVPRTIRDSNFQPERLDTLRTRGSAAYKGLHVLLVREGARDWIWKDTIKDLDLQEIALDIHHIFPIKWCKDRGISSDRYDTVLNKTPLSYRANRTIGGQAPSGYLPRIQSEKNVALADAEMDELLATHALDPTLLRNDAFDAFLEDRRTRLLSLIEKATGKPTQGPVTPATP